MLIFCITWHSFGVDHSNVLLVHLFRCEVFYCVDRLNKLTKGAEIWNGPDITLYK